jgi:hypothetical protein
LEFFREATKAAAGYLSFLPVYPSTEFDFGEHGAFGN